MPVRCQIKDRQEVGMMTERLPASEQGVGKGVGMIRSFLEKNGVRGKANTRTVLVSEEAMLELIQHTDPNSQLCISMKRSLGTITVEISAKGEEYQFGDRVITPPGELWAEPNSNAEKAIRDRILSYFSKSVKYRHKKGVNTLRLKADLPTKAVTQTLGSLILAILLGIILSIAAPAQWNQMLNENLLIPIRTIFLNLLKMIAAPLVFFSLVSSVSQMGSMSELGRVGSKIIGIYLILTVIAVTIGIGVFYLVRPGSTSLTGLVTTASSLPSQTFSTSLKDFIVGCFPSNILSPFLETNMLQLIVLAVFCGLAIGKTGKYSEKLSMMFEACNELFMKITMLIMHWLHVLIFCSILSLILTTGVSSLKLLAGMIGTFLLGLLFMLVIYCLLMLISGINPLRILKSYAPFALQVFTASSSSAAVPINMEYCRNVLQIPPQIYRFSVPLGATINMDGMCILLAVESLTLAKAFGVPVSGSALVSLAFSIIILSIGAPGVPGSGAIIMSMLLELLGVPVEAVTIVAGIGPLVGMFLCLSDCFGDIVATSIVAKSEKKRYKDK